MQFTDIKYQERSGDKSLALGLLLPGGYWVSKKIIGEAWAYVCKGLPDPDCRAQHTAKSMCGEAFWQTHSCGQCIALGRCVKYFVDHEMLQLKISNPGKKGTRKYVRT